MSFVTYSIGKIKFFTEKILKRNRFYRPYLLEKYENNRYWGLGIFVLRGNSVKLGLVDHTINFLKKKNFKIIDFKLLNSSEKTILLSKTRGSDWSNGPPIAIISIFDSEPERVPDNLVNKYPLLDNHNMLAKLKLREYLNSKVSKKDRSDFIHATDNSYQALKYLGILSDEYRLKIESKIKLRNE